MYIDNRHKLRQVGLKDADQRYIQFTCRKCGTTWKRGGVPTGLCPIGEMVDEIEKL